jgi:DNA-binding IclR family transcriptional regulator
LSDDQKPGALKQAARLFEVLEYMRDVRRQVTVRELTARFGYPASSALSLLKSLVALGYLRHDTRQHAFFPTARLATLGDWVTNFLFQGGEMVPMMERIAQRTGQTAILALENELWVQYVQVVLGQGMIQFNVPLGTRRLLCGSGAGWALLSTHDDEDVIRLAHRTRSLLGEGGRLDPQDVLARVREVRAQGYAFSRGTVSAGVGIIAMPLPPGEAGERLAIGVGGAVDRLELGRSEILKALGDELRHARER